MSDNALPLTDQAAEDRVVFVNKKRPPEVTPRAVCVSKTPPARFNG